MHPVEPAWNPAQAPVDAVLRVVLYFDIFHHPLTLDEVTALAGGRPLPDPRLEVHGQYICRAGRQAEIAPRIERSRKAEAAWPMVLRMGRIVGRFPWVRAVFLTGSLSKRSVTPHHDIDFLLLVEHGRVWSVKTLVELVRRSMPPSGREAMCVNYLRDVTSPALDDHTVFTAMELATAVPLYGDCAPLLEQNGWARRWVPGLDHAIARARAAAPLPARRIPETWLPSDADRALLSVWDRFWNLKYRSLDAGTRAQRFKRRPDVSTNHFDDFQGRVIAAYEARCREVGIQP